MEDRRVGLILRALRLRKGWRQADVARHAGVSQSTASRAERGHLASLSLDATKRLFAAVDGRAELEVRWRGGELERLLDERHARLVAVAVRLLTGWGWTVLSEVTYSIYGERGSIDVLAVREQERLVAIFEMKSMVASWEETQRHFDVKARLLPTILFERLGWRPAVVGRFLVFEEDVTSRRRLARLGPIVRQAFPAMSREVRASLRRPSGAAAGTWFLTVSNPRTARRVRAPAKLRAAAQAPAAERGSGPITPARAPAAAHIPDS